VIALPLSGKFYAVEAPCSNINSDTILDYICWMKEQGTLNEISINTNLRGVRAIFYYAMEKEYLPKFRIKLIKAVKKIKPVYTKEELEKLLDKPNMKNCDFKEYRTWAMINYLLATGNRLETLSKVAIRDVDFESRNIALLNTKNKTQYFIPLSHDLGQVLSEYLTYRKGNKEDVLFCNPVGLPLKKREIQLDVQEYNTNRGVEKTSIHVFRHTFAQRWIQNNGDIFRLQEILGHSSLEMVKEYLRMFGNDLQKGFDTCNPLDSFNRERKKQQGERIRMRD